MRQRRSAHRTWRREVVEGALCLALGAALFGFLLGCYLMGELLR